MTWVFGRVFNGRKWLRLHSVALVRSWVTGCGQMDRRNGYAIDVDEPFMVILVSGCRVAAFNISKKDGKFGSALLHGSENRATTYLST